MITIQPVITSKQLQQLAVLADSIWRECYQELLSPEQINYMIEHFQSVPAMQEQMTQGYQYYLAMEHETPIGYAGICKQPDGSLYLSKLYLKAICRGKGYASAMLSFVKEKAREQQCSSIWLTVNRHNEQAIAVYKHLGMTLLREQVIEIGEGFVMDDYVYSIDV